MTAKPLFAVAFAAVLATAAAPAAHAEGAFYAFSFGQGSGGAPRPWTQAIPEVDGAHAGAASRHLVQNDDAFLNQHAQNPRPGDFHHRRFERGDVFPQHRPPVDHYRERPDRGFYVPDRGHHIPHGGHGGRWGDVSGGVLPPGVIVTQLERRGFSDVRNLRMRGGNYIVEAVGPRGNLVKVVLNGHTGEFVGFRMLDRGGHGGGWRW